jgi:hypothetical protein
MCGAADLPRNVGSGPGEGGTVVSERPGQMVATAWSSGRGGDEDDGDSQEHGAEHAQHRGRDNRVVVDIGLQHGLSHDRDQEGRREGMSSSGGPAPRS